MTPKNTAKFDKVYQQLNAAQKKAVDAIDGPVMVVAGPGTGKTQVLTARIANILLKTDTNPSSILALTFTDSAAQNMRDRLVEMIGETGYYVQISTFHAFCSQVIKDNPEEFPIDRDSQPLTDLERYQLFERLIDQTKLKKLKPLNAPYLYLRDIVASISDLKREGVNPDEFEEIIQAEQDEFEQVKDELNKTDTSRKKKNITKHQDLLKLYRGYQQELRAKQRFDFDDMIALVVEAFEQDELFLRDYQEKLHYFLVDEYQDTNTAQNQVVDLLASYWQEMGGQPNVFVVGDPNQAIYRFQGASVENMLEFVDRYSKAQVISLNKGYRCPQEIYDQASQLISNNQLAQTEPFSFLNQGLESAVPQVQSNQANNSHKLRLFEAPVQTLETVFVAEEIKKLVEQGVDPAEIAVLYLYNSDAVEIAQALEKWGIRYEIEGGGDVLKSNFITQLLEIFEVMTNLRSGQETELLYQIMQYDWFNLSKLQIMKLGRAAGKAKLSVAELLEKDYQFLQQENLDDLLAKKEFQQLVDFLEKLAQWSLLDLRTTFNSWFEIVLKEMGVIDWLQAQPNKIELLTQLNSLYNQIKAMTASDHQFKLADFLKAIEVMKEHRLKINQEDLNIHQDAVQLSTVHKAKGQEWDYVFMIHCVDKRWGNRRLRNLLPLPEGILQKTDVSQKERNEDDRRVFYVAMTRARKQVTLSYPQTFVKDNLSSSAVASQFISELDSQKVKELEAKDLITNAEDYLLKLIQPPEKKQLKTDEKRFFSKLVKNFRLSVTALNTYLRDPQEFIENNLLRVPRAKPMPMAFGTAVHSTLEKMFNFYQKKGQKPKLKFVLDQFEHALAQEIMPESEFERRLEYGQEILTNYYQQTADDQPKVFEVERFVGSGWSRAVLDDIYLTGRLDRVDWVDRDKKQVVVIDYKTGKPKTKGYIEGQTKSANLSEREQGLPESIQGPYKRQLLFYKLLARLDKTFKPEVTHGRFEFIEPYDKATGRLMPREFRLKDEDVNQLAKLIKQVMKEIRSLEFLK